MIGTGKEISRCRQRLCELLTGRTRKSRMRPRQLTANSIVSLCLFSASKTLTWRFGKRPLKSLAAFRARSRVSNSFLARPSTIRAYPLVGRSTRALEVGEGVEVGAGVLIRCVRWWRMGNSDVGDNLLNE